MSPRKTPNSTFGHKSNPLSVPFHSLFDINAQTDIHDPSNQPQQFPPPHNLIQQFELPNNNLEQCDQFIGPLQESEPATNCLGIVAPKEKNHNHQEIEAYIEYLKEQNALQRNNYIKERMEENKEKLAGVIQNLFKLSNERRHNEIAGRELNVDLFAKRQKESFDLHAGISSNIKFQDNSGSLEQRFASSVNLVGSKSAVNNSEHLIELPKVEKLPKYCTWFFLDRNQRTTEEQTLANRRRIYYDQDSGEALHCSDSDDGKIEEEEEKKGFAESEDYILRKTVQEFGLSDIVVNLLADSFSRNPGDVQARCDYLMKGGNYLDRGIVGGTVVSQFDKDLDAALDSFDNLFCRRCLVFDCKLHGCSQELIFSAEKQTPWFSPDAEKDPCGPNCHLLVARSPLAGRAVQFFSSSSQNDGNVQHQTSNVGTSRKKDLEEEESIYKHISNCAGSWTPLEKSLFEKGLQIFGRNSCLIARNTMNGWKTCYEASMYMNIFGNEQAGDGGNADVSNRNKVDDNESVGKQVQRRSRLLRRRSKVRRLKYKAKSSGYPLLKKRINTIDGLNPHYNPCGCQSPCVKECGCAVNGNTCEKYCGCPKSCKNRFRGCHCSKSQCQSRHCPCFAANRECDPDVCKNCWISCGDGTLGVPTQKDDSHECRNMKLLLRQQQKIVVGRSDVDGWGAFLTCDVGKDEYIGEYTGEAISHNEAEKRGKLYDRVNSSYLFDLNDQVVLDSFRMGDKLRFANHSANPNCYAKIMMVLGDHRVGIYSKEPIKAGQELFYDYQYQPSVSPPWAIGSSTSTSKKKDVGSRRKAARKHA